MLGAGQPMKMGYLFGAALVIATAVAQGQGPQGGGRGPQGAPPAGAGGFGFQPPLGTTPRPAIAKAKPVRSCESLAMVALPNTTIESAAVDSANPGICRATAITTHPPAGDKIRIWIAIPTSNWNGRFLGTGRRICGWLGCRSESTRRSWLCGWSD